MDDTLWRAMVNDRLTQERDQCETLLNVARQNPHVTTTRDFDAECEDSAESFDFALSLAFDGNPKPFVETLGYTNRRPRISYESSGHVADLQQRRHLIDDILHQLHSPMATELHTIKTLGNKDLPAGTKVEIRQGAVPGTVSVRLNLPGQEVATSFANLPVEDGVLTLPVPLVFLFHANEDKSVVESISNKLWQDGFLTWFDKKDLLPGDDWESRIEEAIERADFVVVFLSEQSIKKTGYVQREIKYAFEQRDCRPDVQRYIIPALIDDVQLPRRFKGIHWLKLWEPEAYDLLKKALR